MKEALIQAFPKLAQIPITETGLPLMICLRDVSVRANRVLRWHLNSAGLKWISNQQWTRPYADYRLWFRTVLRYWVEKTLLNPRALERGYYNPNYIKRIVDEHMAGANHEVALGALLTIELWHRIYLDGD